MPTDDKISQLTQSTTAPADADDFVTNETIGGVLTTVRKAWSVIRNSQAATAAQVATGTATTVFVTPGALKDSLAYMPGNAGTAFPGSPANGDLYYRTDLGLMCFYNLATTQWLTVNEYHYTAPGSYTTTNDFSGRARLRTDYTKHFTRIAIVTMVATTNNGSNYWTVTVRGQSATLAAQTTILTFTTASDTADAYTSHEAAASTAQPANQTFVEYAMTKTNSPGGITVYYSGSYRLVIP